MDIFPTEDIGSTIVFFIAAFTIFGFTFFVLWLFLKSEKGGKLKTGEKGMLIMVMFGFAFALIYAILSLLFRVYI
jgi:hypothetical protein